MGPRVRVGSWTGMKEKGATRAKLNEDGSCSFSQARREPHRPVNGINSPLGLAFRSPPGSNWPLAGLRKERKKTTKGQFLCWAQSRKSQDGGHKGRNLAWEEGQIGQGQGPALAHEEAEK